MARFIGIGSGVTGAVNLSTYTVIKASCSGTTGATSLSATGSFVAGQRLFICQMSGTGVGSYEDNYVGSYTSGTITLVHPLENTYTDSGTSQAQVVVVPEATTVTGSLTVPAWDGNVGGLVVVSCNGVFNGIINGVGKGYRGGARGWSYGKNSTGQQGEGSTGTGTQAITANSNGGGGGGKAVPDNSGGNPAGGGGYGAAGSTGTIGGSGENPGVGGSAIGQAELTSLYMGGGGGGGGCGDAEPYQSATFGIGASGGSIVVVYANTIVNTASILNNGNESTDYSIEDQNGGGGGAGGSILIKAVNITVGSNLILASGGSGGAKLSYGGNDGLGGDGAVGRIRIEACSLSGTTTPTASASTGGHKYCSILGGII